MRPFQAHPSLLGKASTMRPPPRVTQKQMPQALMIPISVYEPKFFLRIRKDTGVPFSIPEITLPQLKLVKISHLYPQKSFLRAVQPRRSGRGGFNTRLTARWE